MWMPILRKMKFQRSITYLTLYSINLCGVFPITSLVNNLFVRYAWFVFATYSMLCFAGLGIVEIFVNEYEFIVYISVGLNFLTSVVSYCNPLMFLWSRKTVVKLFPLMDKGFFTYEDDREFQIRDYPTKKLLNSQFKFIMSIMVIYLGMTLSPMILTLSLKDHENSVFDLLYVAWTPFGIKTKRQFFISFMMQWLTTVPVYTAFISKTVFINLFQREFRYQCDRLKQALRTIHERVSKKEILESVYRVRDDSGTHRFVRQQFVKCDEAEYLKKLSECEIHYQQIQKGMLYFSSWFNRVFSCELTYGFLSFALLGYVLIQGTGNRGTDVKYFCLLGLFGGQLCYQCVISETLRSLEDDVLAELYNIPWYEQTPRTRKNVLQFINNLQNKQLLRGFKIFDASIEVFASILKTSYSYLNILNKMIHK